MINEKFLVKSSCYNVKKFFIIMVIIGAVLSISMFIPRFNSGLSRYDKYYEEYIEDQKNGYCYSSSPWDDCYYCERIKEHPTKIGFALNDSLEYGWYFIMIPFAACSLFGALSFFALRSYELTVTDKRVFGRVAWGKRVDLPVDSVSAIASVSVWKGVSVSTSSGKIKFLLMKNADEIYNILNNLLIERQQKKNEASSAKESNTSVADELKKYKELLDSGIISEAEFEAKKKQLLGL